MTTELEEPEQGKIESLQDIAEVLHQFHGGQDTATYSVASCLTANDSRWDQALPECIEELREFARDTAVDVATPWWDPIWTIRYTEDGILAMQLAKKLRRAGKVKAMLDGMDGFANGYLTCICFTTDEDGGSGEYTSKGRVNPLVETLHPDTLKKCLDDCKEFQRKAASLLSQARDKYGYDDEFSAGTDFWYTRCGHGVGFWDRGLEDVGDLLSRIAKSFGERWPSIDENGILYVD